MKSDDKTRRGFIKKASLGGMVLLGAKGKHEEHELKPNELTPTQRSYGSNDKIRIGFIACGIQGMANARSAAQVPGVEIAGACDLYSGRLERMKELYGDIYTTRDYRELLMRKDIDAICVSSTDHWHDHMTIDALAAGKHVYCEKPMMHHIDEGYGMMKAERDSGLKVQVGSQVASGIDTLKARELFQQGVIGELNLMDIRYDRSSSNGAWQYSIPTDASANTVDWDAYIGDAPKASFDARRFFRWRNYGDYGTGVAGDLFVHLFPRLHMITSSHGPEKIYATGGLRYWKDGRDAPDITLGLYDYAASENHPAFNVQMRVNFVDGSGGGSSVRLIGSEGVMTLGWSGITVERNPVSRRPSYGGWDSYDTFSTKQQAEYKKWFEMTYPEKMEMESPRSLSYKIPEGYNSHVDHWANFIDGVRNGTKLDEDSVFGMRAAAPALAANMSMNQDQIIRWDPELMKLI